MLNFDKIYDEYYDIVFSYIIARVGLFNFLYAMGSFYYVIVGFKWLTIVLCAVFFMLSIYDFAAYKITGRADKIILQLPKSYKEYIHKIMRFFLRDKEKSTPRLIMASVAVGFIVSLVEAVCTGQVYLPTIVLILKEVDAHFWRAILYLLIYNFMFMPAIKTSTVCDVALGWKYFKELNSGKTLHELEKEFGQNHRTIDRYVNLVYLSPNIIDDIFNNKNPKNLRLKDLKTLAYTCVNFKDQEREWGYINN